ncbi:MAG: DUF6658 family protein, partial [Leptolyngbyaceae bacterium]|nr:DUF6658 family protein [Leptolyngbyaceae bacterium]
RLTNMIKETLMKRLISVFKNIYLSRVLPVLFAGILLFSATACGGDRVQARTTTSGPEQGIPGHKAQPYEGGINGYSDIDPRTRTRASELKAKRLQEKTERNVIDMGDDLERNTRRTLDKKAENLDQFGKNLKQDSKTLGRKANRAADDLEKTADQIKENTRQAGKDITQGTQQAAENIQENLKAAGKDLVESTKEAAQNTSDFLQSNTNQATTRTQRNL